MKALLKTALPTLLLIAITSGCQGKVERSLISKINQACGSQTGTKCRIVLKEATPFAWDRLYFFSAWTTSDAIAEAIGLDYHGQDVQDDYRRMLFIQGGQVVHEEDYKSFDYNSSTLDFAEIIDSLSHAKSPFFTPATAVFLAEKGKVEHSCNNCFFYSLSIVPVVPE